MIPGKMQMKSCKQYDVREPHVDQRNGAFKPFNVIGYPLLITNIAMENGHVYWICPLRMVIPSGYD